MCHLGLWDVVIWGIYFLTFYRSINQLIQKITSIFNVNLSMNVLHSVEKVNWMSERAVIDWCFFFFTSVNEHERLPQAHAQEGVLHHQAGEASCQVPL